MILPPWNGVILLQNTVQIYFSDTVCKYMLSIYLLDFTTENNYYMVSLHFAGAPDSEGKQSEVAALPTFSMT